MKLYNTESHSSRRGLAMENVGLCLLLVCKGGNIAAAEACLKVYEGVAKSRSMMGSTMYTRASIGYHTFMHPL